MGGMTGHGLLVITILVIKKGFRKGGVFGKPDIALVPRARVELARAQGPRDFKSRVSTNSTTQAGSHFLPQRR